MPPSVCLSQKTQKSANLPIIPIGLHFSPHPHHIDIPGSRLIISLVFSVLLFRVLPSSLFQFAKMGIPYVPIPVDCLTLSHAPPRRRVD